MVRPLFKGTHMTCLTNESTTSFSTKRTSSFFAKSFCLIRLLILNTYELLKILK
ncbi:hypothetical protein Hanom_Chr07g00639341 [Helianthus anomalus]